MPRPTQTITSLGSIWLIDDSEKMYCRLPRTEGPRQSPEGKDWGGPEAGVLQDLVWHPYTEWMVDRGSSRLIIQTENLSETITAPLSREMVTELLA